MNNKKYQCPNCKRITEKVANVMLVMCPCGYEMVEIKSEIKSK